MVLVLAVIAGYGIYRVVDSTTRTPHGPRPARGSWRSGTHAARQGVVHALGHGGLAHREPSP